MAKTYFIADLHLSEDQPKITQCLETFLANECINADALYVLGDLFEAWLGDDDLNPFTLRVIQSFHRLSQQGVPIYFIHGNRDFLVRQDFAKRAGMTLLAQETVIDLYGEPTLIMHGDQLCTLDVAYQKFRKKSRGWWWPRLVLTLPLWYRKHVAKKGREKSKANKQQLSQEIMDVTPNEVQAVMQQHQVQRLIHGHTHRPAVHDLNINNQPAQRIVLGDWYTQGSILVVTPDSYELETRTFEH